jgi:hypothetical protein
MSTRLQYPSRSWRISAPECRLIIQLRTQNPYISASRPLVPHYQSAARLLVSVEAGSSALPIDVKLSYRRAYFLALAATP